MQIQLNQEEFHKEMVAIVDYFNKSGSLEKIVPRQLNQNNLQTLTSDLEYCKTKNDTESLNKVNQLIYMDNKVLSTPLFDLLDRGGKRWRPALCFFVAEAFSYKADDVLDIGAFCEIVHNATLIIDDIEDDSKIRRDKACVHLIYGVDISINVGMFMCFVPLQYLLQSQKYSEQQKLKMANAYAQEMTVIHLGQGWDIAWHNMNKLNCDIPTEEQYLQMTAHKTGVLARLSTKLTCISININEEISDKISKFAEKIGVAFQIQDDILNLVGKDYSKTKGQNGEDIHEGKLTLIVIHSLKTGNQDDSQRLLSILKLKTEDQNIINEAINIVQKSGSIDYAKTVSEKLVIDAWNNIKDIIPQGSGKEKLRCLSEYVIGRKI